MPGPLAPKTGALECPAIANEALPCRATRLQNEPCTSWEGVAHATHCLVGKPSGGERWEAQVALGTRPLSDDDPLAWYAA